MNKQPINVVVKIWSQMVQNKSSFQRLLDTECVPKVKRQCLNLDQKPEESENNQVDV